MVFIETVRVHRLFAHRLFPEVNLLAVCADAVLQQTLSVHVTSN
jgi:hypothetical protein